MFLRLVTLLLFLINFAFAEPLSVKEAFGLTAHADEQNVEFRFAPAPNIHVYKDSLAASLGDKILNSHLNFPKGEIYDEREVYTGKFSLFVPINLLKGLSGGENFTLKLEYQGCAKDGICYQPQVLKFSVKKGLGSYSVAQIIEAAEPDFASLQDPLSEQDSIAASLSSANFLLSLATFFSYGLLLSLTPCIFPMIPILSSIIVSKQASSSQGGKNGAVNLSASDETSVKFDSSNPHAKNVKSKNSRATSGFFLSLIYVFAMACAYAVAGVAASVFGSGVQSALQTPAVLIGFSLVFVALALSMFGLYELQMPLAMQNALSKKAQSKGGIIGVFAMGFLSALIASPCVAAPLAGALLYIAQSGNALFGGLALFTMGLGMGVPLLLIGASSGKILPRPGAWMDKIKTLFGFIMLIMAVWLSARVLGAMAELLLYGVIGVFASVFFGAFDATSSELSGGKKLLKGTALLAFIYSVLLIVGSFSGAKSALNPLEGFKSTSPGVNLSKNEPNFIAVSNLTELENAVKSSSKPVLIDFYATWCASCNELDEITFKDEAVLKKLENFTLLRVDVTKNSSDDARIMKKFGLIGPPAILFFRAGSHMQDELKNARLIGFYPPEKFLAHLEKFGL
ncbi:protein-disulfide reductase DsbD [Campylobacter sp. Marseille-Q3452]|uniref:Protein-disulfide reductase DsbD n=1 Tax=Campylobacter massiliensis TaxID=2762557 RepID=A0A842JAL8_9BACT|nr:protein-disulfide reductase DsbD [Campylobacter massiliensis]MBC2882154.1 protein-disulfide reductase DsbD [Campylobacter massiliensis]